MKARNRLFAIVMALVMAVGGLTVFANDASGATPQPLPFTDVALGSWYYPHVRTVWENNLFNGTTPTTFDPQGSMTRAMFVQVLANMEQADLTTYRANTTNPRFNDTAPTAWYFGAVEWAASQGLVYGIGGGNFVPRSPITRQEMAVMLNNYIVMRDISLPNGAAITFTDQADISAWAIDGVTAIQAAGIIAGYPDGSFGPQGTATRAEVATIFARYLEILATISNDEIAQLDDTQNGYDEDTIYNNNDEPTEYFTLNIANITGQGNRYGTVTIVNRNATTYEFATGTSVTVRATAASGYVFDGWFSNASGTGTAISRNSSHTFTITADTNLFARFRTAPSDTGNGNGSNGNDTTPPPAFIAVTGITMTSASTVQEGTPLTLTATVSPSNATNRNITWSVQNAGTTGATISSGNLLNTTGVGTVTVRATITNGATTTTNFTQDFTIAVTAAPPPFIAVTGITMTSANTVQVGTPLTLTATVAPNNATNQTIAWSVSPLDAGGTGATITSGNILNTTTAGTATIRATITNGATATTNFTQDFTITVTAAPPPFVAVTNITGVDTSAITAGQSRTLGGTIVPSNATNQTITWSVENAGTTGANITGGNVLNTATAGTVIVRATVVNGATATTNFTQDFIITVNAPTFTVTMTNDGNGTANASPATTTAGTTVTITATPTNTTTHQFYRWVVVSGGVTLSSTTANPATFTMPASNVEIRAEFELTPQAILAQEVARLYNNGNPHIGTPHATQAYLVLINPPLPNGVSLVSNIVATTMPSGAINGLLRGDLGAALMVQSMNMAGNRVPGLYVFDNVILQIGGVQSAPFTLRVIIE